MNPHLPPIRCSRPGSWFRLSLLGGVFMVSSLPADTRSDMMISAARSPHAWQQLASYSRTLGVAGILAGVDQGRLIAAGGANFPDGPPWAGGKKVTHADMHVYDFSENNWRPAGTLPEARGYAAMVATPEGLLALGGENAALVFDDSLWLRWRGGKVETSAGPRLPAAMTSAAAVLAGRHVYLAAGYDAGPPRVTQPGFWRIDLDHLSAGWERLPDWPGPSRGQAVMASQGGRIYLLSGLEITLNEEGKGRVRYLTDAYRYDPESGAWEQLPEMPHSAIAAPSPAPVTNDPARLFVLGGVDGRLAGKQPRDTRVPADIIFFDVAANEWKAWPEKWPDPVVTTPAAEYQGRWFFVSGEIMSGVRTPAVWSWQPPVAAAETARSR